jgi:alkanesulfonate monooxygenase SsuD/methylene tetrahydromethanopterin reductase-like flavin-dependent oxidoreductase (luciferase family)
MPDMEAPLRFGASCWNQYTDWPAFLAAHQRADELGFDSLWTWDHLYPIVGSPGGPIFEAYTAMAAIAATTYRATVGLLVSANTFRNPALVAKMVTTLDHISGGRAVLGIGAAWFETEHLAFGLPFGERRDRLRWLGEALPIMRGMLDGTEPTARGEAYHARSVRNDPRPLHRIPVLVAGDGPKVTLRLVAEFADACNVLWGIERVRTADAALLGHCASIGRDEREIERTLDIGAPVLRDSPAEARRVFDSIVERNGGGPFWVDPIVGTAQDVVERCAPYLPMGYRHVIFDFPSPYDEETMVRLAREVRPRLQALLSDA